MSHARSREHALRKVLLKNTSLTRDSYDGEADDPAPPAAKEEPVQRTAEPQPIVQAEPVAEGFKTDAVDNFIIKTDDGMQGVHNGHQGHGDDYDRPIGIKEDGYV